MMSRNAQIVAMFAFIALGFAGCMAMMSGAVPW